MSKLKCVCGHIIIDQTDNISYKGYILPDTEVDPVLDILTHSIDSLIEATRLNKKEDWICKNFSPDYPIDLKESSMIHDLILRKLLNTSQHIFECEKCGRIIIEIGSSNHFEFYKPDNNKFNGIIKSKK